jgi:exopolysaccharide biosynthesis polyprenyl glycosylphosphotransferase
MAAASSAALIVLVAFLAFLLLRAVGYWTVSGPLAERVLILGAGPLAHKLVAELQSRADPRRQIVGVLSQAGEEPPPGCRRLGCLEELDEIASSVRPQRVVVALVSRRGRLPVQSLLDMRMQGIAVEDGVELYERLTGKLAIESLVPSRLIFSPDRAPHRASRHLGRAISVLLAGVALAVCAPAIALIAFVVVLDSGWPAFFLHERIGLAGRRFHVIKFRTMRSVSGATSEWERDNLDRVTRVGRWLRDFRLDELPQFWNVLRGDMNLVGPRPHPVTHLRLFSERIPYYRLRLAVRPGITGWAQVRYSYANNLEEETEKMRYDLYYIRHMSVWLDLRVFLETVKIVCLGRPLSRPRFAGEPTLEVR